MVGAAFPGQCGAGLGWRAQSCACRYGEEYARAYGMCTDGDVMVNRWLRSGIS